MNLDQGSKLLRALDVLGATQVELSKISARSDDRRRHDLIAQRRLRSAQVTEMGELAERFFGEAEDAASLAKYRQLFAAARSKAALHQANWSAVRIGDCDDEYRRSAREAGEAYRTLSVWMRDFIAATMKQARPE